MSTLDSLVAVSPRFARSVALARDAHLTDALDGYILTPTGRDVLKRLTVKGIFRGVTRLPLPEHGYTVISKRGS